MNYFIIAYILLVLFTLRVIYCKFANKYETTLLVGFYLMMALYETFHYMNVKMYLNVDKNLFQILAVIIFFLTYRIAQRFRHQERF
jgi:hypothetical protein